MRKVAQHRYKWFLPTLLASAVLLPTPQSRASGITNIYSTGFESAEGYSTNLDLAGQNGWVYAGSGGNGILDGVFPGSGQQAYVGYAPPIDPDDYLYVWKPIDLSPVPAGSPVVQFEVELAIIDSMNGNYDSFSWEVFNAEGDSLLEINFDNFFLEAYYAVNGGTNLLPSGVEIDNNVIYELTLTMDFQYNWWRATLDDGLTNQVIASGERISNGDPLNLGDISALWRITPDFLPGDNYMVFDNYTIDAYPKPSLEWLGFNGGGGAMMRLFGEPGCSYVIEAASAVNEWTPVHTNLITGTFFGYTNANALSLDQHFYRGRLLQ